MILVRTPYNPSIHLKKNKESRVIQTEYAKIIGNVMFLMNYTRPNIAYAISRLSRYTQTLIKSTGMHCFGCLST